MYHIMARLQGPCMGDGVRLEVKVCDFFYFFFYFFFFKNDNLFSFQSRTEDLTHNACDYVLVSSVRSVILKLHSPMFVCKVLYSVYF